MADTLDPVFAAGLRSALVDTSNGAKRPQRAWWRRSWVVAGLSFALLAGAGGATATLAGIPGGEVSTTLGATVSTTGVGDGRLYLGEAPDGADAVEYTFTPLTGGTFALGAGGTRFLYTDKEAADYQAPGGDQLPLGVVVDGYLSVTTTTADAAWSLTAAYVSNESVPLATNARGETYGTVAYGADPDLIAAMATNGLFGYVRREDLQAVYGPEPTSPAEALERQQEPGYGIGDIPVYQSDGVTVIGEFEVG
ncbi:hypothetical protein [Demequina zhanjiangensis]|uniref:Uncharacterized protein n=1 Tax=Demequina zhanjiangensis TaxID=3051659 RepID=A0ABT8G1K3_9MICO|nr:hypothetical protein [Demequina sp. SYSU T00b26]MDN4473023.1 hypothetical protein [Demequina sp. SYSU T00b26]